MSAAMLRHTLRSLRANAARLLLSSLAIVLGIGFVTGTLIFADGLAVTAEDRAYALDRPVDVDLRPDYERPTGTDAGPPILPAELVERIRDLPGVVAAEGLIANYGIGLLDPDGQAVPGFNGLLTVPQPEQLRALEVTAGRLPQRPGEAVLDARTADRREISVGDEVQASGPDQPARTYRLVGLVDVAGTPVDLGGSLLGLLPADAQQLTGRTDVDRIVVAARPGTDLAELAARVDATAGDDGVARTRDQVRADALDDAVGNGEQFTDVLLAFAAIAVFVAAFVIANTFTILLAQRTRESALLRLVGATRGQLFRATLVESVVIGVIGAVWGLAAGVVTAAGLHQVYTMLGSGMPATIVVTPGTVLVALSVGVGVTVGAALLPAWRATAVAPVSALTDAVLTVARPVGRVRLGTGLLLIAAGVAVLAAAGHAGELLLVVVGGILTFLGLVLASPLIVPAVTRLLGVVAVRAGGATSRLAVANAIRNPRRAAATAMALVIGIGLVSSFAAAASSVKAGIEREVAARIGAAFLLTSDSEPVPDELMSRLAQLPQIGLVHPTGEGYDEATGNLIVAAHPDLLAKTGATALAGDLADLAPGRAVADAGSGLAVGDEIRLEPVEYDDEQPAGQARTLTVVAVLAGTTEPEPGQPGRVLISADDFAAVHPENGTWLVQIEPAAGIEPSAAASAVEQLVVGYPNVQFMDRAAYGAAQSSTVDTALQFVAALLALAIFISLLGVANTLTLSVVERTRENALLRAVGLTRGQLRGMLSVEAVLMAVTGAVCGIVIGVAGAASVIAALNTENDGVFWLDLPWGQFGLIVAVAGVAALLASVLPARRALRQPVVESLAAE
ncbi:ABC transporter permease [Solwaraspora sp. WMMB335]|uniref:ABC transporter permease n=1 Tax=Solwaraspora sp. WMMB335 TaxID=3404118 RepID=UPI003B956F2B